MSHFAVFCPPLTGHLNPMTALASGLVERGHRVTFVGLPDTARLLPDGRIELAAIGRDAFPPGSTETIAARMARTSGLRGLGAVIRATARMTDILCQEGVAALEHLGSDAIIADQTEAAGGILARRFGLPQVSVANALLIDREPDIPPFSIGWGYRDDAWGRQRNRGGYRGVDWALRPIYEIIARYDRAWRLGGLETVDDCLSRRLTVSQTVAGFDFPRKHAPRWLAHVGPLRGPEQGDVEIRGPRPVVFCSLGTLKGDRADVFRTAAEACRDLDLALHIAHGGKLDPTEAASFPGAPVVRAFVPQRALLRHCVAAITHGGLNTVLDALAAGVPMIVVPLAFEQGAIAARVERTGAGIVIPPRRLTTARLRTALARLMSDPTFKRRAAALAREVASSGGVMRAADLIETTLGLRAETEGRPDSAPRAPASAP